MRGPFARSWACTRWWDIPLLLRRWKAQRHLDVWLRRYAPTREDNDQ